MIGSYGIRTTKPALDRVFQALNKAKDENGNDMGPMRTTYLKLVDERWVL
jgi:hypothetical protein